MCAQDSGTDSKQNKLLQLSNEELGMAQWQEDVTNSSDMKIWLDNILQSCTAFLEAVYQKKSPERKYVCEQVILESCVQGDQS